MEITTLVLANLNSGCDETAEAIFKVIGLEI